MSKSFTLIEILVVISIIILISGIVLINYRPIESQLALQRSTNKLALDIRRAAEMAMAAREIIGPTGERIVPLGGYGIFFQILATQPYYEIILFADCNNNKQYDLVNVCGTSPNVFSERIENLNLEREVRIQSLFSLSQLNILNITFIPPDPTIYINNSTTSSATVTLTNNNQTRTIRVNNAGLIYVE